MALQPCSAQIQHGHAAVADDSALSTRSVTELTHHLKEYAQQLGFDAVGIATAGPSETWEQFRRWLQADYAGEMNYLRRREAAYQHPASVLPTVRSLVMVALSYHRPAEEDDTTARLARYARGKGDYHDLMRDKLRRLGEWLQEQRPGCHTRPVVDTAPLLERDWARRAGLGWFGKNTMLLHKRLGSYFFLGALLTDVELQPDAPHSTQHCGTCTRCLEACPTQAFPAPGILDARRCIAYLTIELKTSIPRDLRAGIHDWLFGCDICQEVCPWNRKAVVTQEPAFRDFWLTLDPLEILALSLEEFRQRFQETPLARPGFDGLRRNALIVAVNQCRRELFPWLLKFLQAEAPLLRETAAWGLGELDGVWDSTQRTEALSAIEQRLEIEQEVAVVNELHEAADRLRRLSHVPTSEV
ncbi:MAG: epoxyqueuosine reductase [Planctomycetaceae bacterium]|nr:MAG: epoxyqueuosine reductase [Planctomycetaceae bacterium]